MLPFYVCFGGLLTLLVLAALTDLRERRIPNWLTGGTAALYPVYLVLSPVAGRLARRARPRAAGRRRWGSGCSPGELVGGGDVKLIAAISLWAGLDQFILFALVTALTGGVARPDQPLVPALEPLDSGPPGGARPGAHSPADPTARRARRAPDRRPPTARRPDHPSLRHRHRRRRRGGRRRAHEALRRHPMGLRRIIVLLIALIAAGGTAMYARSWIQGQQIHRRVAAPAPKQAHARGAGRRLDLPAGTFVKPQHLRWQPWPTDDVPESYVLRGRAQRGGDDRRGGPPRHRGRRADHRRRRGQARRARLPRRGAQPRHARGLDADQPDLRQFRPDLPGRPGRPDPDPVADRQRRRGHARRVSETVLKNLRIIAMGADDQR